MFLENNIFRSSGNCDSSFDLLNYFVKRSEYLILITNINI